jgi:hypothetical protein
MGCRAGGDKLALKQVDGASLASSPGFHVAFEANSHEAVESFPSAALKAGGKDNGAPGLREHYGPPDSTRTSARLTL